jgi:hypothetical protein
VLNNSPALEYTFRSFVSILGSKGGEKIGCAKNAAGERTYRIAKIAFWPSERPFSARPSGTGVWSWSYGIFYSGLVDCVVTNNAMNEGALQMALLCGTIPDGCFVCISVASSVTVYFCDFSGGRGF